MYTLPLEKQIVALHLLVEGNSIRSVERLTGVHRDTIMRLMVSVGGKCRGFLDTKMRDLDLKHLECDEIWTFCKKKQRRLSAIEARNPKLGDQFLFVALDLETKLIPSFVIGKRTMDTTRFFMDDLVSRLVPPRLHERRTYPQVSTDGWLAYPTAVDEAFSGLVNYGVLIKDYENLESGRYAPPDLLRTIRRVILGDITKKSICTSHVERQNLSIRTFMKRFTRLALGFSKKWENLVACTSLYIAYYNFCWMHKTLRMPPAMKAGIAWHPWTLEELLDAAGAL